MTLLNAILKKVQSHDSIKKFSSPPPELEVIQSNVLPRKKRNYRYKYDYVRAKVDSSSPHYDPMRLHRPLAGWTHDIQNIYTNNVRLLLAIRSAYLNGGKVDSHWTNLPKPCQLYADNRIARYKKINTENKIMYKLLQKAQPRVVTTATLQRDWQFKKQEMVQAAQFKFILFPITPQEDIEDHAFVASEGVKRPRVYLTLRRRRGAILGKLAVELFTEVCPNTCRLFLELVDGETGYGYVGTQLYRKVPRLFCSGGDVVYDNGFGCYAQKGRSYPIGAENYHFSHSMPGLLSMHVTRNDEMCGIFNITFKPLPQFDLENVVFGRIIRPSNTYNILQTLGSPLGTQPAIEISAARRKHNKHWVSGIRNTRLKKKIHY